MPKNRENSAKAENEVNAADVAKAENSAKAAFLAEAENLLIFTQGIEHDFIQVWSFSSKRDGLAVL